MARPRKTVEDTPAAPTDVQRIKILERRLSNPFGQSSAPIDLRDSSLEPRWFNGAISSDKIWRAKRDGWVPVRPEDLLDQDQVGGFTKSPDGYVTRGDRGQEVLMAMPRVYRRKIEIAKAKANMKNMGDPVATKNEIVGAASDRLGDEAADYLDRKVSVVGGVRDQHEIIHRENDSLE